MSDFAVFILTYKRPNMQLSYNFLRNNGYSGDVYFVVDDTDPTIDDLKKNVSNDLKANVLIFNKKDIASKIDTGLAKPMLNFAVFSRNAIEQFAKELNLKYFVAFDDDVKQIIARRLNEENKLKRYKLTELDDLFNSIIDFMKVDNHLAIVSPAQTLMFFNKNIEDDLYMPRYRECGSVFFRNASIDVEWGLNMLEDVITSYRLSRQGYYTTVMGSLQAECAEFGGKNEGGNSDVYRLTKHLDCIFPTIVFPDAFYIYISEDRVNSRCVKGDYLSPMLVSSSYKR